MVGEESAAEMFAILLQQNEMVRRIMGGFCPPCLYPPSIPSSSDLGP